MLQLILPIISFILLSVGLQERETSQLLTATELPANDSTVYYLIRHAEKSTGDPNSADPVLSAEGLERATKWAGFFKEKGVDAIYSTNYKRTRQTAMPISEATGIEVEYYEPREIFSEDFLRETSGKKVVVVGHSNTTPAFANFLLKETKYQDLPEGEYSTLYIIRRGENGKFVCETTAI